MTLRNALITTFALLLFCGAAFAQSQAISTARAVKSQDATQKLPALVGTWRVTFDRPPGPPGVALVTFTSDGTSVRTTDKSPVMSASHGAWMQVNDREFQATWHAFQFDEKGVYIGNQKASFRVSFGAANDQFTGMARGTAHALDGTLKGAIVGPFSGTRVMVDPYVD